MSQLIISSTSGVSPVIPPEVPESFVTDNGTAVPIANVLIVHATDSNENTDSGIIINGGTITGNDNQVDVVITNRLKGSTSTSENNPNAIITFFPQVVGTYVIEARIGAFNSADAIGAGYSLFATVRFDGSSCTLCGTPDKIVNEEGAMSGANVYVLTGGTSVSIMVIGYLGSNISWNAVGLYTFVGV